MKSTKQKIKEVFIGCIGRLFFRKKVQEYNDKIIILRLDAIGDYILFRNFIEIVYKHYQNKRKIILCGNIKWKDLAENLDGKFVDQFIWINGAALKNPFYMFSVFKRLRAIRAYTLWHPTYSRTNNADLVAMYSGVKHIVGWNGDESNINLKQKLKNNKGYTRLLETSSECIFEFYRNRLFFEEVLNQKIDIDLPFIKLDSDEQPEPEKPYIMMFPGAGEQLKIWSPDNFAKLYKMIQAEIKMPLLIGGSDNDRPLAQKIVSRIVEQATDITGKMNLMETVNTIQKAAMVIANDTGPLHIALALNVPSICVSNGKHYGRFVPYPASESPKLFVVLPDEIDEILMTEEGKKRLPGKVSFINIDKISPEKVFATIENNNILN